MPDIDPPSLPEVRVWHDVDAELFHADIKPLGQPAVLKGLVSHWPIVAKGSESPQALSEYISGFGSDVDVHALFAIPEIKGRYFYSEDMRGFNFERRELPLAELLDNLLAHLDDEEPPGITASFIPLRNHLESLIDENSNSLLDASVQQNPGLWIGNRGRTSAHWDDYQNIACIVGGRRLFTLFPPEQTANLYVGPINFTVAGQPLSLVDFHDPDYERFPRFKDALATAQVAELGSGDALYIPPMWYHHVESLEHFNVLINFWWRDAQKHMFSPFYTLFHALLSMRDLPEHEKKAWRAMFDHYIFELNGDPMEHVPEHARGILGKITPEIERDLRRHLLEQLGGEVPRKSRDISGVDSSKDVR